jgi:hypothetical protein
MTTAATTPTFTGGPAAGTRWNAILFPALIVGLGLSFGLIPLFRGELFFLNDNVDQNFPHTNFFVQAVKSGVIPQWWPGIGAGIPEIAEDEANYFPVRLVLASVLNAPAAFMAEISLCFAVAGLGTYLFLGRLGLNRLASLAGALSFMFGSQMVVYVRSMALLPAGCLLPWVMWLAEVSFDPERTGLVFCLAPLVIGMQFLAGNPTFAVVTVVALVCYLVLRIVFMALTSGKPALTRGLRILGLWLLVGSIGVGIAGVQVVPTFKHLSQSIRAEGFSFEYVASTGHSQIKNFPQSFFPYVYSLDSSRTAAAGFYDGALMAAAVLFCLWQIRKAGPPVWCLTVGGLIGALLALGASTPLYGLLYRLPVFGSLRFPMRYQFWTSFCFACLGAIGLNSAMEANGNSRFRSFLPPGIAVVLLTAITWRMMQPGRLAELMFCVLLLATSIALLFAVTAVPRSWLIAVAVAANLFLLADLTYFRARGNYARAVPVNAALRKEGAVDWLLQDTSRFRIFSLFSESNSPLGQQNVLAGSAPTLWNLKTLGYHASLPLRRYQAALDGMTASLPSGTDARRLARFLGFLQAKYVIAPPEVILDGWEKAKEGVVTVWKNPEFHEGEFLVGRVQREGRQDDEHLLDEIRADSVDFRQTAIIAADELPQLNGLGDRAEVRVLPAGYDAMDFQVSTDHAALLVIPSNFYPGWAATVNGAPAHLYRTNWIGMGVLVTAGESRVTMRFSTPGLHIGALLSVLSVVCWLALALFVSRRPTRG